MSAARHLESRLPKVLEDLSGPRTPDYFDDILGQVSRTRQRPGWTFIERWLPMTAISKRIATTPRVPLRLAVGLALLLLTLALTIVLIAGSQRPTFPAPFGVAGNGLIVFEDAAGAIRVGNLADGSNRVIVSGPDHSRPVFSPDGRRLAFLQRDGRDIVVSGPAGESPKVLNLAPLREIAHFGWTPDSTRVIAVSETQILAFDPSTAGAPTAVAGGIDFDGFNDSLADIFRPPAGDEILFTGPGPNGTGIYRIRPSEGDPIPIFTDRSPSARFANLAGAEWSPDGTRVLFTLRSPQNPDVGRAWIVNVDGSDLRRVSTLEMPGYEIDEEHASWSPDGTRVAFARWFMGDGSTSVRPVTIVDLATGDEKELSNLEMNGYGGWSWSPDGTSILQIPGEGSADAGSVLVVDATTGEVDKLGWSASPLNGPDWQRTVPTS